MNNFNHYLSLTFASIATLIDFTTSDVDDASLGVKALALMIVLFLYYIIVRGAIAVIDSFRRHF